MKKRIIALLIPLILLFSYTVFCADEKVIKEVFELSGGDTGNITFTHEKHQNVLRDCMICHNMFPKKTGGITEMIRDGKLKNKQVMNQCIACHRKMKKSGEKAGPTSCSQCHKKP